VDLAAELFAVIGSAFVLLSGIGVLRFGDVYARMHAATKASALGIVLVGVGATLALDEGRPRAVLAVVFILITAPSAAHFVARAAYRAEGIEVDLEAQDDLADVIDDPDGR
jgi:multicomponent Na+:H+ antiporter subunit G